MSQLVGYSAFRHAARPEWGVAVIAWEREGKRGYQFEDGQLRVFTSGYYYLLDPIGVSSERLRSLKSLAGASVSQPAGAAPRPVVGPTLDEQIGYFLRAYPGGFAGDRWRSERRGGSGRALRRHRDPAIAFAREQLTADRLAAGLDQHREREVVQALLEVVGRTDLVTAPQLERLASLGHDRARALVSGLRELLFGEASIQVRMVPWVRALTQGAGRAPTWAMATVPLALLDPDHHVCVQRTSFVAQAASVAPHLEVGLSPGGADYPPLLDMAQGVRERLEVAHSPGDLLDVADFISFTLSAAARKDSAVAR
jgi:hypothetical protein